MTNPVLIGPIRQLVSLNGLPSKGAIRDEDLVILEKAGIVIQGETILQIGDWDSLKKEYPHAQLIELEGDFVALPGWVDCHTHLCFGGSRARDFAMRNAGKSYLEIAQAGGGIWDTVTQTRNLSLEELAERTVLNAKRHLSEGVTTIEVKSGYGLSPDQELKILRAISSANKQTEADLIATCLAAHMKPRDFEGTPEAYLNWIATEVFPVMKAENLSNRVDAFIEKSAFSPSEIHSYFQKAKEYGFDLTVHADQFTTGGSEVAVKFGALSADHLEVSGEKEIQILAQSTTCSVALPGASLGLGCAYTPARKILNQGGALAIASDWNPGSAPMGDLICQASILATFEKLSTAEVFAGLTFRAAQALGLQDRGKLAPGFLADFNLFGTNDYREVLYQQGKLKPVQTWKSGRKVNFSGIGTKN